LKTLIKTVAYLILIIAVSAALAFFLYDAASDVFALDDAKDSVRVTVPEDADMKEIAGIFKESGLIRYPLIYRVYSKLRGDDGKYLPGDYVLSKRSISTDLCLR